MKSKFKELLKRTCAMTLAIACFMSSACFLPVEKFIVWADTENFEFFFKNNISGEEIVDNIPVYMLEGVPISILDNLSEYTSANDGTYSYNSANPFDLSFNLNYGFTVPSEEEIEEFLITQTKTDMRDAYVLPLLGFTDSDNYAAGAANPGTLEFRLNPVIQYSLGRTTIYEIDFNVKAISYYDKDSSDPLATTSTSPGQGVVIVEATLALEAGTGSDDSSSKSIDLTTDTNTMSIEYIGEYPIENSIRDMKYESVTGLTSLVVSYPDWGPYARYPSSPTNDDGTTNPLYPTNSANAGQLMWQLTGDATGYFQDYYLSDVGFNYKNGGETANIGTFTFSPTTITSPPKDNIIAKVTFDFENIKTIHSGSIFKFNFTYKTSSEKLSFLVKNRQTAVNELVDIVFEDTVSYENSTAPYYSTSNNSAYYLKNNHSPFVYSANYSLDSENDIVLNEIKESFYLKTRHAYYNYSQGFYIQWEWQPYGEKTITPLEPLPEPPIFKDYTDKITVPLGDPDYDTQYEFYKNEYEVDYETYENDLSVWQAKEQQYYDDIEYNEELYNVINIPTFGIEEDDSGDYSWIGNDRTINSNGQMLAKVTSRTENTSGQLVATVFIFDDSYNFKAGVVPDGANSNYNSSLYDGTGDTIPIISTRVAPIEVTIIGTGVEPTFYITETIMATYDDEFKTYTTNGAIYNESTGHYIPTGSQTTFPVFLDSEIVPAGTRGSINMDINNGVDGINTPPAGIPDGYDPPAPEAPHTVKGSLDFGAGIELSDRLVITNKTSASSTASIYMRIETSGNITQTVSEYTFTEIDETWTITLDEKHFPAGTEEYIYNFTIIAKDEGVFSMQLDFFNSDMGTYPRTTLNKTISIGSSLPSAEAKIDKVYLHLVQDVVNPDNLTAEEERVKDVLDTLYSDKSVTGASDNPLKGEIPTDIIYNTDFTYNPAGYYYYEMELPYVISDVMLTPIYEGVAQAGGAYNMDVTDPNTGDVHIVNGYGQILGEFEATTGEITLLDTRQSSTATSITKWIEISTLAADNATSEKYYLKLVRQDAEEEVLLDELYVDTTDLAGSYLALDLTNASGTVVPFVTDPIGIGARYYISLPYYYYSQQIPINITAISNGDWAKSPTITSDDGLTSTTGFFNSVTNALSNKTTESFLLEYSELYGSGSNNQGVSYPNKFTVTTYAEGSNNYSEYYLTIYIEAPDKNDDLSNLEVMDPTKDDEVIPFKNGNFMPTKDDYIVEIPYELQKYRFSMLPDSNNTLAVRLIAPDGTILGTTTYANAGTPIQFLVDFNDLGLTSTDLNFTFTVAVQSEDGVWSDQYNHPEGHSPYTILFQRDEPNSNSLLGSLDILNYNTSVAIPEYAFEMVKKDYIFTVPYTTDRIIIKPTAQDQDRTDISINGVDFPDEDPGKDYSLTVGAVNTFVIVVTAEDGSTTTYNLYITRAEPDTEARLLNLVVNGSDSMTPALFVPSTFTYDVTIPAGTLTYTITPTAVSEYATIYIDNLVIPSGTATNPYNAVDENVTTDVIVWAQDGVTTETYTLNITNHNLIEKSDEAELLDLNLQGVDLAPAFMSNVYDYEVYTKPDTILLQAEPTISKGASVTVSVGSKKLDEVDNIYSTSFFTDTDKITITVTSESGEVSKSYLFDVYKNTEGKEGIFQPITDEDVDFEGENPIVVDISAYAVVDASVFNTLKNKYPDKTLVLTGNDYMLRINGADITEDIPHTTQYDFGFSFTSPEEPLIREILDNSEFDEDADLEPIYLYFNDHTALPATMILTAVLGSSVGNSQLYWNYYNTERDRIDYYGYVQSNSKGTITVPLTHLSTYMVTTQEIGASENRTNTGFGSLDQGSHQSDQLDGSIGTEYGGDDLTGGFGTPNYGTNNGGDISGELTDYKPNPQTEVFGFPISTTERGAYEQTTIYKWYEERRNKKQKQDNELEEC